MTEAEFNAIEKLYHYTNFESSLKIIESNTLLFNPLKRMNDINELYRPLSYESGCYSEKNDQMMKKMVYNHQQISLTRDDDQRTKGFDIPAMWGHYADRGRGVCLIFDKEKLMNTVPKEYIGRNVEYLDINQFDADIVINEESIKKMKFSDNEYRDFFFTKTEDWSYEQEFRIIALSESGDRIRLDYKDALIGVIANRADDVKEGDKYWNSVNYRILKKHCDNIFIYESWGKQRHLLGDNGDCVWTTYSGYRPVF